MDEKHEDLAFDIAFALSKSPFKVKKAQNLDVCRIIARKVVEHLERCLWTFDKKPPREPH